MTTPLDGIKVLEISIAQFGPHCGVMLADMGADVIKVEPLTGEMARNAPWPHETKGIDSYFLAHNRGKKGLALDYTREKGKEIIYRLAEKADVFLTNYRLGTMQRNGFDYESIQSRNPQIIYAQGSPFGPKGEKAHWPGFDLLGVAASGLMTSTRFNDETRPHPIGAAICDQVSSMLLAYGIMTALFVREKTGIGQQVDVSLFGSMLALQSWEATSAWVNQTPVPPADRGHPFITGMWSIFEVKDGWIAIAGVRQDVWHGFCRVMGILEFEHDERFADDMVRYQHRDKLKEIVDKIFLNKTREEWLGLLREADIIISPVNNHVEAMADPQAKANNYVTEIPYKGHDNVPDQTVEVVGIPVELSKTPGKVTRRHPDLGEHTNEVLLDLGYTWDDIAQLATDGVI